MISSVMRSHPARKRPAFRPRRSYGNFAAPAPYGRNDDIVIVCETDARPSMHRNRGTHNDARKRGIR